MERFVVYLDDFVRFFTIWGDYFF